jgi:hypothetical protein
VGSRSPGGLDQIPYRPGGWILHQPPWSFGFDSQTRGTRENRRWNKGDKPLRQYCEDNTTNDKLEFNWGYETPERNRSYATYNKKWDQIDVRMHFFDQCMQKTEWKDAADCMWFVQDYADFMGMLQQLTIEKDENNACTLKADDQLPNYQDGATLPSRLEVKDRACHRFSVLSWFFDCRDAGACRYKWEDWVLEYFGAYIDQDGVRSDFENFMHVEQGREPLGQLGMPRGDGRCACERTLSRSGVTLFEGHL